MVDTKTALMIIAVVALVTLFTRALPFLFFRNRATPKIVTYLGIVLPQAIIAMLIVYCLKGITLTKWPYALPEGIAVAAVVGLHLWKRNNLLSILGGTVIYMVLVQFIFAT